MGALLLASLEVSPAAQDLRAGVVAAGFQSPTDVATPPTGDGRLFVTEQDTGRVRIAKNGSVLPTPFLDLGAEVGQTGEMGLLGIAFHPDFGVNRKLYLSYTDESIATVVREVQASASNPDVADLSTLRTIFGPLPQPTGNHNGGCLRFGPDGMLYLSVGDGGECCADPFGRAQDVGQEFGKLLRFDVDSPAPHAPTDNPFYGQSGASNFVWALGFRNPWRFSFDRLTGDVWIADVGSQSREEVSRVAFADAPGANFGWNCMEGFLCTGFPTCACNAPSLTDPVHDYVLYQDGTCAVIGGFVYRGQAIPSLFGRYLFADICAGKVWSLGSNGVGLIDHTADLQPPGGWAITSFGEAPDGELFLVDSGGGGRIWLLEPGPDAGERCELMTVGAADGAPNDEFAAAVAVSGSRAVVGAGLDDDAGSASGSAYVLEFAPALAWFQKAKLKASDAGPGAQFGAAVAIEGALIAVGAPHAAVLTADAGAAYVYEALQFAGWTETARLFAADGAPGDEFGAAVGASAAGVAVGAPGSDAAATNAGAVYVYDPLESRLLASDAASGHRFGGAVGLSGQRLAVGAESHAGAGPNSGAVYVFERDPFLGWVERARLLASDGAPGDRFGHALALDGDTLVVGAHGDDDQGVNAGAAYLFEFDGSTWSEVEKWRASDGQSLDQFGFSVALDGEHAVVGAHTSDQGGNNRGAGYLFDRLGGVWLQTARLTASDAGDGDQFGRAVGIAGDDVLIGSRFDHAAGSANGSAYVYQVASELDFWGCPLEISIAAGGAQRFELDPGPEFASQLYWVLGSGSGTTPGFPTGGFVFPLNFDSYMLFNVNFPNLAPLKPGLSLLDAAGQARPSFTLPANMPVSLVGLDLHHAYGVIDLFTFELLHVSNPVPIRLVP